MDVKTKNITVLGLARSGVGAANLLHEQGARVTVSDMKSKKQLADYISQLESQDIRLSLETDQVKDIMGADMVILSPGIPETIPAVQYAREHHIPVISEVELAFRFCSAPIVAITGSNGKTTTTTWTGEIMKSAWKGPVAVAGNIGKALSEAVRNINPKGILVAEISSFQLETIESFQPRVAAVLNISQNHLDRYPDMDAYANSKLRIFEFQNEKDYALLNLDNPELMNRIPYIKANRMYFSTTQGVETGVCLKNNQIVFRDGYRELVICSQNEVSLPGNHNLENAMAATAIACCMGVPAEAIANSLKTFQGVEHRLEFIREYKGVRYYNDSKATTVVSVQIALSALPAPVILIMGGKDKGSDYTPLRKVISSKVRHLILIGQARPIIRKDLDGCCLITECETMEEAIQTSYHLSQPGDSLVLSPACSSYDMFRDFEHRGEVFKELIRKLM